MAVRTSIENHPLGREITVRDAPTIEAGIVAPAEVRALAIVRDSQFIHTTEPKTPQAELPFTDLDLKPGQSAYYYVRALVGENDIAWSSPIWVVRE